MKTKYTQFVFEKEINSILLKEDATEENGEFNYTSYVAKNFNKLLNEFVDFKDGGITSNPMWKNSYNELYAMYKENNMTKEEALRIWKGLSGLDEFRTLLFFYVMEEAKFKFYREPEGKNAKLDELYKLLQRFPTARDMRKEFYDWCDTKEHTVIEKPAIDENLQPGKLLEIIDSTNLHETLKDGFRAFFKQPEVDVYYIMKYGIFFNMGYGVKFLKEENIPLTIMIDGVDIHEIAAKEKRKLTYDEEKEIGELNHKAWDYLLKQFSDNLAGVFPVKVRTEKGEMMFDPDKK